MRTYCEVLGEMKAYCWGARWDEGLAVAVGSLVTGPGRGGQRDSGGHVPKVGTVDRLNCFARWTQSRAVSKAGQMQWVLYSVFCLLFCVQGAVYQVHCTVSYVRYDLYMVQFRVYVGMCMVCSIWCVVYGVLCMVCCVWCAVYRVMCTVCSVHCTVCSVQCEAFSVQCIDKKVTAMDVERIYRNALQMQSGPMH